MKLLHIITAGLLSVSMSFAAVGGELRQSMLTAHAEDPDPELLREYAEIIVNQVNDARLSYQDPNNPDLQLSELKLLPVMCDYAQIRADEIVLDFSHNRPLYDAEGNLIEEHIRLNEDGSLMQDENGNYVMKNCFSIIKENGFPYSKVAENIAAGNYDPVATFYQWMNSDSHRQNILSDGLTHIGIGYYYEPDSQYKYYWSMFLVGVYEGEGAKTLDGEYYPVRETGDADGSHRIDSTDAERILKYAAALNAGKPERVSDMFLSAADVNADGEVSAVDASILLSYVAAAGVDENAKIEDYIWK